ncbi:hypothetical protein KIH87_05470 [Paraneptunicella aestuarii]|uniref:competence protein CoiA n=1 Tax=Paraneptunicella aestuarii TaxID=2831148 RepID=UPI001E36D773|nr:competence protein CoiA family protein [Paraneptunicella aestuarii]UAA39805.1 hypothetical protein KIH87_05470 [Paraneptunicella aestuarii]
MTGIAINNHGEFFVASNFSDHEWEMLKEDYVVGEFLMPCCRSPAILKTSPNGLKFFAHYSDECATAPETIWHIQAKESLVKELRQKSINARSEVSGGKATEKWKADIYFEHSNRKIAFEIQHSYQHLRDYFKRQKRYEKSNVECYWILYKPRFVTVSKSIAKYRIKEEFGNIFPEEKKVASGVNQISSLPIVWFESEENEQIKAPGFFSASSSWWIDCILNGRFCYSIEGWRIQ